MTYYFIDDFDNICRQKDSMDKDFAEVIDLIELINDTNKIQEENEQLKSRVDDLEYQLNYVTKCKEMCFKDIEILDKKYEKLREENKELKKQMNRLYNYFMDWHGDEMGGNQFSEMWDMVKEDERWEEKW